MLQSLIGSIIALLATTSLLLAIQVTETIIKGSIRFPLTKDELEIIKGSGRISEVDILNSNIKQFPQKL
ncbi:hypothetical protein [Prochlorococcus marinus]|uniref:hypothetical protein n=1 Tax=Prochlorococcus marinus TaxID=1219 RepID=UPI0022B3D1D0|nr:hypothetical protein [Prochlorococcus marinus]